MEINFKNKQGFLILGTLIFFLIAFIHWDGQFIQYLYFLRVPLIAGLLLFTLPIICIYFLPTMLGNLFVLSNALRMAFVIPGAVAVSMGIVLVGSVIGVNADERFGVVSFPLLESLASDQALLPYALAIFLSLPTILAAYWSSGPLSGEMSEQSRRYGSLIGFVLSVVFLWAIYKARTIDLVIDVSGWLMPVISILPENARAGFIIKNASGLVLANGHLEIISYMLVSTLLYFVGLMLYRPSIDKMSWQLPAISYVLGLLQITSLLLGLLTFLFDFYRIPVLLSILAFSAFAYYLWKVDHYYELRETSFKPLSSKDLVDILKKRLARQEDTLVVVCASGGGIQAAGWTTMVLTGLQKKLGDKFSRAIGLISSVSGGSVGSMYFLDQFKDNGVADPDKLDDIFVASTQDSLGATGWGLVYPDLWRIVGMPYLQTTPRDRGDAINTDWKSELTNPSATLHSWSVHIKNGLMPIPVFNATLVEDGRHYLISPLTFELPEEQAAEFNSFYPGCDIDVSTAALLSATFPYVSPVARNSVEPKNDRIFHVADGGFFDNFGIVTAVDWLNRLVLPQHEAIGIKRVLLVEIRAFADEPPMKSALDKPVGWKMALFGPLLAIFAHSLEKVKISNS